jgi:hypothetical protein
VIKGSGYKNERGEEERTHKRSRLPINRGESRCCRGWKRGLLDPRHFGARRAGSLSWTNPGPDRWHSHC